MPKRRGRGEGSIEKLPSGNYRVVISWTLEGKRIKESATFTSKSEALDWKDEKRKSGPTSAGTLGDWLDTWTLIRKTKVSKATWMGDNERVGRQLRPHLGTTRLRDLTTIKIERWIASLAELGQSTSERQKAAGGRGS